MAMIQCPECGQEISDKAKKCIYCGYPLEDGEDIISTGVKKNKKRLKINFFLGLLFLLVVAVITSVYYAEDIKPRNIYNDAMELLEIGKYEEANKLLNSIQDYGDVDIVQEQIKYESYAYTAINSLKKILKNPDSYQPYEIHFYEFMDDEESYEEPVESQAVENVEQSESYPACIMYYGAQNGFGGNTTGYALFYRNSESSEYELIGACNSLDQYDYIDSLDENALYDAIICKMINYYFEEGVTVGTINMDRLKTVLKNDTYNTIKIIE